MSKVRQKPVRDRYGGADGVSSVRDALSALSRLGKGGAEYLPLSPVYDRLRSLLREVSVVADELRDAGYGYDSE